MVRIVGSTSSSSDGLETAWVDVCDHCSCAHAAFACKKQAVRQGADRQPPPQSSRGCQAQVLTPSCQAWALPHHRLYSRQTVPETPSLTVCTPDLPLQIHPRPRQEAAAQAAAAAEAALMAQQIAAQAQAMGMDPQTYMQQGTSEGWRLTFKAVEGCVLPMLWPCGWNPQLYQLRVSSTCGFLFEPFTSVLSYAGLMLLPVPTERPALQHERMYG